MCAPYLVVVWLVELSAWFFTQPPGPGAVDRFSITSVDHGFAAAALEVDPSRADLVADRRRERDPVPARAAHEFQELGVLALGELRLAGWAGCASAGAQSDGHEQDDHTSRCLDTSWTATAGAVGYGVLEGPPLAVRGFCSSARHAVPAV